MEPELHNQPQGNEELATTLEGSILTTKTDILEMCEGPKEEREVKETELAEKNDCAVDVKRGDGSTSGEKVCRICHLSSEHLSESLDLIQLGCGCKDELSFSHLQCAETWFKQKGNRLCEVCGKIATNVTTVEESRIVVLEWNEMRLMARTSTSLPMEGTRRLSQTLCNLLLACLVLALILPWFFWS